MMLGSFFDARGPILGIAIGFLAVQDFLGEVIDGFIEGFTSVLPSRLPEAAAEVMLENPLQSM